LDENIIFYACQLTNSVLSVLSAFSVLNEMSTQRIGKPCQSPPNSAMMNETTVRWIDELTFAAQTGSGHQIVLDGQKEAGASPMEMLLVGMAGCTAIDVVHILKRQRQPIEGLEVTVRGERAEDHPKVYTHISVEYVARGPLDADKVQRAIALSEEKYCSASAMLGAVAHIASSFRIEPD